MTSAIMFDTQYAGIDMPATNCICLRLSIRSFSKNEIIEHGIIANATPIMNEKTTEFSYYFLSVSLVSAG